MTVTNMEQPSPSAAPMATLEALRQFNRNTAIDTLLPPLECTTYRQRLIFTDENLHTMLLRHVLNDAWKDVVSAKQKKGRSTAIVNWPRELCVVGSRVVGGSGEPDLDEREEERQDIMSPDQSVDAVCYFARPSSLDMIRLIAKKIKRYMALQSRGDAHLLSRQTRHNIIFVPNISAVAEAVLREQGITLSSLNNNQSGNIRSEVTTIELPIDIVPLDEDVLSMESSATLRECLVDNMLANTVQSVAGSLIHLQEAIGVIKHIEGLGPISEQVIKKMMDYRMEDYENEMCTAYAEGGDEQVLANDMGLNEHMRNLIETSMESEVHSMLIIDRTIDLVTPMLTPLTYVSLILCAYVIS